tara:strand:+ start:679 stop:2499 length:1821 start_codon:yes stop_codon:yes gene_type:complete
MASFKDETVHQESLQCLACAAYQKLGNDLDADILRQLMFEGTRGAKLHEYNKVIWENVGIHSNIRTKLHQWAAVDEKNDAKLYKWLQSSVWVAEAIANDSRYGNGLYKFYRVDQFPGKKYDSKYSDFKATFAQILKNIKAAAKGANLDDWGDSVRIYADKDIKLMPDKWNPADFVAVEKSKESVWKMVITQFVEKTKNPNFDSTLSKDLEEFLLSQSTEAGKKIKAKVEILQAMATLYEYNKEITRGIDSKEFIPISLKQTTSPDPGVSYSKISEPGDVAKYFHLKVKPGKFKYTANTNEASCAFKIIGVGGGDYTFTMRSGASTEKMTGDVTNELKDLGVKDAQGGKVAYSVSTKIAKESGADHGFAVLNKKRKELWDEYSIPGEDSPTKGVFWEHTVSKTHGFTDWRVFDTLAKVHNDNLKAARKELGKGDLSREQLGFDRRIDPKTGRVIRATNRDKLRSQDPTGIINDIKMWAAYAEWLSDKETTKEAFLANALGKAQWNKIMLSEAKERFISKKKERRRSDWKYNITLSQIQMKYMKNKIQAYEQAWLIDPSKTASTVSLQMKKNILKGMWMYAASKGFVIFKRGNVKAYLLSGAFIKCAA